MIILGIIASLFPDIDLKTSRPYQFFKAFVYTVIPLITLFYIHQHADVFVKQYKHSIIVIYATALTSTIVLSFIFVNIFHRFMVHRGLIHSIPFALVTSILIYEVSNILPYSLHAKAIALVWLVGFITHLALDEIFSVDLLNSKLKKSFGTALSLVKCQNMTGTAILYIFLTYYFMMHFNVDFIA